jgi:uncharacterized repeat protein (TIGR02543 family)
MMKVKIDKNCNMMVSLYLLIFLFSLFSSSCDNFFIQKIVDPRTANFESNGGSSVESQTVFRDQPVKRPSNPSKIDHTFAAWYRDNNTFEQEWDFADIPNADITLYAKWIVNKTVTGIAIKTPQTKMSYAHGETLNLSGLEVTLTYDDSTTDDVAFNNFASRGITASPVHGTVLSRSTHNNSPVTITYGSFTQTTGNLTVGPRVITFTVNAIPAQAYTGSAITPTVIVRDGATILTLDTDYTVSYIGNTNAGNASVSITGINNYAGSTGSATFVISNAFITSAAITVMSPVKGGTPVTTAGGTGNFTVGTVSWSPNNNPFAGGTVYTASVTLTANANYAFAALTGANATINGINAAVSNNTGNTVTLSHTFAATETKAVTGITIKTQPTKLTYTHGEALNLLELVVTLSHDDTTTEDVALSAFASKNISVSPANGVTLSHSTHNDSLVTVTYGSFTQTIALTVNPRVITFNVSSIGAQNYTGSTHEPTVTVRDGTTTILTENTDYTVSYTNNTNAGTATVTVTGAGNYAGSTGITTFTINKINPTVTWPTGLTVTYGQTLSAITLPGNTGGTAGLFSWTEDGTTVVGNVGTRTHNMTFTPTDAANYNTLTQNVNITVNKATGAAVSAPTAETVNVTSVTLNTITIPDQNVEFAYNTTNTAPTSGWQTNRTFSSLTGGTTYYFFARSAENSNFNAGAASTGTAITTTQNIGITVTIDASELEEKAPALENTLILSRTASGGYQKTASVAITGTYQSINWEIFGPTSVSGTTSPITLNAEDVRYNSLGYHTVTVTVTVNGMPYPYQANFRFRIVE